MKFLPLFCFLFLVSCHSQSWNERTDRNFSKEIKNSFKNKLPQLDKINFFELMGRVPSPRELELGRALFNDPILSRNNDVSCATCHLSNHGFADGNSLNVGALGKGGPHGDNVGKAFSEGVISDKRSLGHDEFGYSAHSFMFRNSLSTINVAYRVNKVTNRGLFWDGRFGDLLFQVLLPIHTGEEMCGDNPIVLDKKGNNLFQEGGKIFDKSVRLTHTNSFDSYTGLNTNNFNGQPIVVKGIPYKRPNNSISIPNRNECLALAIAKLRKVKFYQQEFKTIYQSDITDRTLSMALSSFILTHVSQNTSYDKWLAGKSTLNNGQLKGLAIFFTPIGEEVEIGGHKIKGAGCISCHSGGTFGGKGFASLGVRSDLRSSLSRPIHINSSRSGFFDRPRDQRGLIPSCHIEKISASEDGYAPDIGLARGSLKKDDCFQMRIPPLRNVIETFPYFHHGSEKSHGQQFKDFKDRAKHGLKNAIRYHLRGPIHLAQKNRINPLNPFFDDLFQLDTFVPYFSQNFLYPGILKEGKQLKYFPLALSDQDMDDLVSFVAEGLYDPNAVKKGALGNDVSHPSTVPSGLNPSITRDHGHQLEFPK